jgi:hypothetical protein
LNILRDDGSDTCQELIHCFFHRIGDLKSPNPTYLMGPTATNHSHLQEAKEDLRDINKSLTLDQARSADLIYVTKWNVSGLTAFRHNHEQEYGAQLTKFNGYRNTTGAPGLKCDNTAIEVNFASMQNVKRAPIMQVSRKDSLLTQSQAFCDKNFNFCCKGGVKEVFTGPKLNIPQDLDILSSTFNCPKSILLGGVLLNPATGVIKSEKVGNRFLLKTLAIKFPKIMSDIKRVFLTNKLPYTGIEIPISDGSLYAHSLLGDASQFSGGYLEMRDWFCDRYCCVAHETSTKLFADRMKYVCSCNIFGDNCRCSGEILSCDKIGVYNNQLHHSIVNSDTSRNIIDLPARFNPGLTELQQIPRPLKEQIVNNLSIGQLQRSVFHSGFKGCKEFEGTPQVGMTRDVCRETWRTPLQPPSQTRQRDQPRWTLTKIMILTMADQAGVEGDPVAAVPGAPVEATAATVPNPNGGAVQGGPVEASAAASPNTNGGQVTRRFSPPCQPEMFPLAQGQYETVPASNSNQAVEEDIPVASRIVRAGPGYLNAPDEPGRSG